MASYLMQTIREMTREMTNSGMPMFGEDINAAKLREVIEEAQGNMPLQPGVTYEPCTLAGLEAELSVPAYSREDAIILYLHGGGLVCGNARTSRGYAGMLAGESRIPVYSFSYHLAPEDPYPAAVDDCVNFYKAVMDKHPDIPIFLIGESGGGLLCVTTALKLRDEGVRAPAAAVIYSPVMDFSGTIDRRGRGYEEITVTEPGLGALARLYCPDEAIRTRPLVSPYFADFTSCCPMYVSWDKGETLAADAEALIERLEDARVPVEYHRYEGCFHAFAPVGRNTPESSRLLDDSIAFMLRHLHDQHLGEE